MGKNKGMVGKYKTISNTQYKRKHKSKTQPGGTAMISTNNMALHARDTEIDQSKLGRWTWTRYRGKDNLITRIITVYLPNKPTEWGDRKVYFQQQKALIIDSITEYPLKIFWEDLWEMVDTCQKDGEQIILMGDWNQDVREEKFLEPFKIRNLKPSITERHGNSGPGIYQRGTATIDEIFTSFTIEVKTAGYLEHEHIRSDHRITWVYFQQ